jgi:hypothetical protein
MLFRSASRPASSSQVRQAEPSVGEAETIFNIPPKNTPEKTGFNAPEYIRLQEIETEQRIQRQRALREAATLANPEPPKRKRGRPSKTL